MLRRWAFAGLPLLLLLTACDTDQPAQTGEQTVDITVSTTNVLVPTFDVWDAFEDKLQCEGVSPDTFCFSDDQCVGLPGATGVCAADGLPDDNNGDGVPEQFVFCRQALNPAGQPVQSAADSAPWNFTIEIEILRAGEFEPTRLTTSLAARDPRSNLALYDDLVLLPVPPACPPGFLCPGSGFLFENPRRLTGANRFVLERCLGLPTLGEPGFHSPGGGVFPRSPQPLSFPVSKGDTVIVRARKPGFAPQGLTIFSEPSLVSLATLDGQIIESDGSPSESDGALSYSFTIR